MAEPRIIVIGAGPAGVRCAAALVEAGIRPTVIDEGRRDGGQIFRRQPENFTRTYRTLYGTEAGRAEALHRCFDSLRDRMDYRPETLVWNIAGGAVYTSSGSERAALSYDALIVCSGAADRLMPLTGWNLAGTFTLGGAQVALKSQACAIGRRVAFLGTGPLLYLVAAQYLKAGAGIAAVIDTSPLVRRVMALRGLLAQPAALWNGVGLTMALRRARVPLFFGAEPVAIEGDAENGVSGLSFRARGGLQTVSCDAVAMGYHLRPEAQLADLAQCEFTFDESLHQWRPRIDADGRSSVPNVYLAGDGTRILGARAAELSGRLAALATLRDLGRNQDAAAMARLRRGLKRYRTFAEGLAAAFPWPAQQAAMLPDEAVVCRCEAITAGELRRVVQEAGACEANRAKAFSRVGMGRCQGRYCGDAGAEIISAAAHVPIRSVGRLRGQAPVKPLNIQMSGVPE